MDYIHEEDGDYPDEDEDGGRRRRIENVNRGRRRSNLMTNIRKIRPASLISKPLSKIGSGRHSSKKDENDEDDDSDSSSSSSSDDSDGSKIKGHGVFLRRKKKRRRD